MWLRRPELDHALASGAGGTALLELRAEQLVRSEERHRIADWIELVMGGHVVQTRRAGGEPLARVAFALAHADLVWLVAALRTMPDPSPQGVAMALELVRDDASPLYTTSSATGLRDVARRIGAQLATSTIRPSEDP